MRRARTAGGLAPMGRAPTALAAAIALESLLRRASGRWTTSAKIFSRLPAEARSTGGTEAKGLPPEYYAALIAGVDPNDFPEFPWPQHALDLIEWVRGLPMKVSYIYGDPYGKQSRGGKNLQTGRDDDWYSRMTAFWSDNNLPLTTAQR